MDYYRYLNKYGSNNGDSMTTKAKLEAEIKELKKKLLDKIIPVVEINLFDEDEVIHLSEEWIKLNKSYAEDPDFDNGDMYYMGVCSGVEFVLHLMKRMGD